MLPKVYNLGVQLQVRTGLAVTGDFVWRHSINKGLGGIVLNAASAFPVQ